MKTAEEILREIVQPNYSENTNGIIEAMHTYAAQFQQEWVDVKDRLPEDMRNVLIYNSMDRQIYKGYYWGYDSELEYHVFYVGDFRINLVTHWQPLPSPPKEKL